MVHSFHFHCYVVCYLSTCLASIILLLCPLNDIGILIIQNFYPEYRISCMLATMPYVLCQIDVVNARLC
jgi:hypothetical protein